jgi:hypothetical protein
MSWLLQKLMRVAGTNARPLCKNQPPKHQSTINQPSIIHQSSINQPSVISMCIYIYLLIYSFKFSNP